MHDYGLRNCGASPRKYMLSEILYDYSHGANHSNSVILSVPDETIKDGSWDVQVPARHVEGTSILKRLIYAWAVFIGRADVLFYE